MNRSLISSVLLIAIIFLTACERQKLNGIYDNTSLSFPFLFQGTTDHAIVYLAPDNYNSDNLEKLFLWFYKKNLSNKFDRSMVVFTDKKRMVRYLTDSVQKGTIDYPIKFNWWPFSWKSLERKVAYDAIYSQHNAAASYADSIISDQKSFNVSYSFLNDLQKINEWKNVVIRGSAWTEGQFNIQTISVPWNHDTLSISTYNLFNIQSAGKHLTAKFDVSGKSLTVFNLLISNNETSPSVQNIQVLDEKIAYMFFGWCYAVTVDNGQHWALWDAEKSLNNWNCCNSKLIQGIALTQQGNGIMEIQETPDNKQVTKLYTSDYGHHWTR